MPRPPKLRQADRQRAVRVQMRAASAAARALGAGVPPMIEMAAGNPWRTGYCSEFTDRWGVTHFVWTWATRGPAAAAD